MKGLENLYHLDRASGSHRDGHCKGTTLPRLQVGSFVPDWQ